MKQAAYNNEMVAHVWAQQTQDYGRNSNTSFYFQGDTIWSYGNHFPIARFVKPDVVLFTTRSYSTTTQRHISLTRQALRSQVRVLLCHNPLAQSAQEHADNLAALVEMIDDLCKKASIAKSRLTEYLEQIDRLVDQHNLYIDVFRLTAAKYALSDGWKERALKRVEADKQHRAEQVKIVEQYRAAAAQEQLKRWRAGEINGTNLLDQFPVALRVKPSDHSTIETTRGAEVPKKHARKLWGMITAIRLGALPPYRHNGHSIHIGLFTVDSINAAGDLQAGCHNIRYEEMADLAMRLGWAESDCVCS